MEKISSLPDRGDRSTRANLRHRETFIGLGLPTESRGSQKDMVTQVLEPYDIIDLQCVGTF